MWAEYLLFLAKSFTLVVAVLLLVAGIVVIMLKSKKQKEGDIEITKLNDRFDGMKAAFEMATLSKDALKQLKKDKKQKAKEQKADDQEEPAKPRLFVLNFEGDIKATDVASLREEVTAVLTTATDGDEVLLRLESGGGLVHAYGLAASQLSRLKSADIKLTVAVDKVAASGGYMMASVADKIIAAPFAIVGSIGVLAQIPNFNRVLDKMNVDFEQLSAGKYKRTLTLFGKNTDEAREKMQEDIEDTHVLFQQHIIDNRAGVDIEKVSTGEHWYGLRSKELGLIDDIETSDEFIMSAAETYDVYEVCYETKESIADKLSHFVSMSIDKVFFNWIKKNQETMI